MRDRGPGLPDQAVLVDLWLRYRMATLAPRYPALARVHDLVAKLPGVHAYLGSARRIAFNEQGIFRHYPELDGE